jgi:PKD repeat protein
VACALAANAIVSMRGWLAFGFVVLLLVPGCADKPAATGSSSSTAQPAAGASGTHATATATGATVASGTPRGPNQPPVATLAASVPGGTVPLRVNFTLAGSDPDQDPLNWTLSFGDGSANQTGSVLPAAVAHNYTAPGLHKVVLNVTDGSLSVVREISVNTTAGAAAAEVFTGKVVMPDAVENSEGECLFALMHGTGFGPGGIAGDAFGIKSAKAGWAFAFDVAGMVAQFQDAAGYVGDKAATGTVPEGATGVLACSHSAVNTSYTLTLSPP